MTLIVRIAVVTLLILAGAGLAADDTSDRPVVAVALLMGEESEDTVRRVILSSIEVYLNQRGLVTASSDHETRTDLVLEVTAIERDGWIETDLALRTAAGGQGLARASGTLPIGLTLDRSIAALAEEVLRDVDLDAVASRNTNQPAANPTLPPEETALESAKQGDQPRSEASATELPRDASGAEPSPQRPSADPKPADAPPAEAHDWLTVSTLFAPLLPVDVSARYLGFGYGGKLALAVYPFRTSVVGLGLTTRILSLAASGFVTDADVVLLPIGVSIRMNGSSGPMVPYGQLEAGVTLLRANHAALGAFSKTIPYVGGEVGVQAPVLQRVDICALVAFEAHFEGSLVILGFSPGIGIAVGL